MVVMQETVIKPSTNPPSNETDGPLKDVTFVEALNEKYVDQEEFNDQFKVPKDRSISTEITFVGFGRVISVQKQLRRLVSIDLSGKQISKVGNLSEVEGLLNRVTVLNLANNRLGWQEIIHILATVPNLREIILSENILTSNVCADIYFPAKRKRLFSITLGRVDLDWSSLISILSRIWSSIEQVDLWDNRLSNESFEISDERPHFVSDIKTLKLSQNRLTDLNWITRAGNLDSLRELDVSRCQIVSLNLNLQIIALLKNLSLLIISYNNIAEWSSLSSLNQLPRLTHLICNDNPIFITEKSAKALTVARISTLTHLNREEISPSFRRDSEIMYLRQTYKLLQERKSIDLAREHSRYNELVETYGVPEDLNAKQTIDKYITVDLRFDGKSITKKLPCDMRVSNLHMLCKRLFKLKPSVNIEITCSEPGLVQGDVMYPLDKEGQTLHFFSVKNNHRLTINQLD